MIPIQPMNLLIKIFIMKKHVILLTVAFLILWIFTSCVAKKKYDELESQRIVLNQELDQAKANVADLQKQNQELQDESQMMKSELNDLSQNITQVRTTAETVERERDAAVSQIRDRKSVV